MQRPSNKQSRGPNKEERLFLAWCKEQPSIVSGEFGVEVHHCAGSSAKTYVGAERVHIGHMFCIPLTPSEHKMYHTQKRLFEELNGPQNELWLKLIQGYNRPVMINVMKGIALYGK